MAKTIKNKFGTFIEEHKCSGNCCRFFFIGGETKEGITERIKSGKYSKRDRQIPDMLIPLTFEEANKRDLLFGSGEFQMKTEEEYKNNAFTCKNLDDENGKCLIYKDRPDMCRTYPYCRGGEGCEYKNCTLKFINSTAPITTVGGDKQLVIKK